MRSLPDALAGHAVPWAITWSFTTTARHRRPIQSQTSEFILFQKKPSSRRHSVILRGKFRSLPKTNSPGRPISYSANSYRPHCKAETQNSFYSKKKTKKTKTVTPTSSPKTSHPSPQSILVQKQTSAALTPGCWSKHLSPASVETA
jgi:hypothetical protein